MDTSGVVLGDPQWAWWRGGGTLLVRGCTLRRNVVFFFFFFFSQPPSPNHADQSHASSLIKPNRSAYGHTHTYKNKAHQNQHSHPQREWMQAPKHSSENSQTFFFFPTFFFFSFFFSLARFLSESPSWNRSDGPRCAAAAERAVDSDGTCCGGFSGWKVCGGGLGFEV
jgi:hypothetical protein